jgi:20S proteasome subunit beta 5
MFTPPTNYLPTEQLLKREFQLHGTTTVGFRHQDSIIVCVDSKASMGTFVSSRTVKKIIPISKHIVATMAGGAADCAAWIREVAMRKQLLEIEYGDEIGVVAVARILSGILRKLRGQGKICFLVTDGYFYQRTKMLSFSFFIF